MRTLTRSAIAFLFAFLWIAPAIAQSNEPAMPAFRRAANSQALITTHAATAHKVAEVSPSHTAAGRNYFGFDLGLTFTTYVGNKNFIWGMTDANTNTGAILQFDNLGSGLGMIAGAKIGFGLSDNVDLEAKLRYISNYASSNETHVVPCPDVVNSNATANAVNDWSLSLTNLDVAALLHYALSDQWYLLGGFSYSSLLSNWITLHQKLNSDNQCSYLDLTTGIPTGSTEMTQPGIELNDQFSTSREDILLGAGSTWLLTGSTILDAELAISVPVSQWLTPAAQNQWQAIADSAQLPAITFPSQYYLSLTVGIRFPFGANTSDDIVADRDRIEAGRNSNEKPDADGKITLRGRVTDSKSGRPVDANMTVVDLSNNKVVATDRTDGNGEYAVKVKAPGRYSVTADADGYLFGSTYFEVDSQGRILRGKGDIKLDPSSGGRTRLLVFFDFDKDDLKAESYPELDRAVRLMKAVPSMEVEIAGYTDSKGAPEYNVDLSQRRANAVREYLIKNGIPKKRLTAKGYGMQSPIASNDTDEGRAENRRVEFVVVKN